MGKYLTALATVALATVALAIVLGLVAAQSYRHRHDPFIRPAVNATQSALVEKPTTKSATPLKAVATEPTWRFATDKDGFGVVIVRGNGSNVRAYRCVENDLYMDGWSILNPHELHSRPPDLPFWGELYLVVRKR